MQRALLVLAMAAVSYAPWTAAQPATCPTLVSEALIAVGDACGGLGRNQVCYGNLSMLVTPRDPDAELDFDTPGERIGVPDVRAMQLSSLSQDPAQWGVAIMALQANLPENLPGQNATIVLFGEVELEDRGGETAPLPEVFVTGGGVNVRQGPTTSSAVVGRVGSTPQRVVGRLADGSWLRVVLEDGTDGWVSASVVTVDGDAGLLGELTADDPAPETSGNYGPMQAFRLRTGIGAPACSEAPADGILIQTPEGTAEIKLEINKVTVYLASTAVVRAVPGGDMRLTLLEGSSSVGSTQTNFVHLDPFQTAVIALDDNGEATEAIRVEEAQAEDYSAVPVGLLPRLVEVPQITAERPVAGGVWYVRNDIEPDGVSCTAADGSGTPLGFADGEGEDVITVLSADEVVVAGSTLQRSGDMTYSGADTQPLDYFGYTSFDTIASATFASPTRGSIERTVTYNAPNGQSCSWQIRTEARYVRRSPESTNAVPAGRWNVVSVDDVSNCPGSTPIPQPDRVIILTEDEQIEWTGTTTLERDSDGVWRIDSQGWSVEIALEIGSGTGLVLGPPAPNVGPLCRPTFHLTLTYLGE